MREYRIKDYLFKDLGPLPKWFFGFLLVALIFGIPVYNYCAGTHCPPANKIEFTRKAIASAMTGLATNQLVDGWGHPLRIEMRGTHRLVISAGSDGRFGTDDDVTN